MPYFFQGKEYSSYEFYKVLVSKNQTISFSKVPKYKQQLILDGDDINTMLNRRNKIYTNKRTGICFAITSK